jgi:MFS family permease
MSEGAQAPPTAIDYPPPRQGYFVLTLLVVAYILSFVDRMVLTMLVDPIRATLHLSDFQISLLYGLAFSLCYTFMGVPMGRLADRYNRRNLIIGGVLFWSAATIACGLARSFAQMFVARMCVGVGESTLTPSAHSLLSDYFPPETRSRVLSIYTSALYMGSGIGTFGAGVLIGSIPAITLPIFGAREPWQVILLALGLLGLPMALAMTLIRDRRDPASNKTTPTTAIPFPAVIAHIWQRRGAYLLLTLGLAVLGILTHGIKAWIPSFLMRTYGWAPADVGLYLGMVLFVGGAGGVVGGGLAAEWLRRRGYSDANVRIGLIAALLITPLGIAAPLMPSGAASLGLFSGVIFLAGAPFGAAVAAVMAISPSRMRAQASALFLLGVNVIGLAGGPIVVAAFTDFVFKDDQLIAYSLASLVALTAPLAAIIIWLSMKPYRAVLAQQEF